MAHEFDGKKYEKASAHQKEWGAKLISELGLKENYRVLDLGCGDGFNTALIAEELPSGEVVGIDASKGMINTAYPRTRENLSFLLMDINDLNFVEEFDIVFSNAALHWVLDHDKLLKNSARALRDHGQVRFNFAADGNCSNFFRVICEAMAQKQFLEYFSDFQWPWYMPTVEEYSTLAKASGFSDINPVDK